MIRRNLTNQFGAFVPTETEAIRNADRKSEKPIEVPRYSSVMREKDLRKMDRKPQPQPPTKPQDEVNLKRARQVWYAISAISAMMDFRIEALELRAMGDPARYHYGEGMKTLEKDA